MRTYEDFHLWISGDGEGGYLVGTQEAGESQSFRLDVRDLDEKVGRLAEAFGGRSELKAEDHQEAKDFGYTLFKAIFPLPVYGRWREVRARRGFPKKGLRLRLHFERASALAALPWELLFDGERFFCLSSDTPIVRHPEFLGAIEEPFVERTLRLLAVLPEPLRQEDLDVHGELLDLQKELDARIADGSVVVEPLERSTFRGLSERLKAKPPVQALHFAGHGQALSEFADGALCFEKDGRVRHPEAIPGFALAPLLSDARELRFVFLNACEGGRSASIEEPGNLAHRLLEAGVPAVVALQAPIGNRAAKTFGRAFYQQLAKGCPLEESVAAGRQALQSGAFGLAWASPVLYLRAATGHAIRPRVPLRRFLRPLLAGCGIVLAIGLAAWRGKIIYEGKTRTERPKTLRAVASDPRCPSPRGLNLAFVKIEPGRFMMGARHGRGDRKEERPAHPVEITKSYCIGAYEVTVSQLNAVLNRGNAPTLPGFDLPAVSVSWEDTQEFVAKLNERDPGGNYRLPSEAELEFAGRAGGSGAYVYGDRESDLKGRANCKDTGDRFVETPAPIGSFEPNHWGLYDIHGNVEEWVADWYAPYSLSGELEVDPKGPASGADKVRRGGSFKMNAKNCASWSRKYSLPDYRQNDLGFRIARSPITP